MYEPKNLRTLAYTYGFTLWHYVTKDSPEIVKSPGYFNGADEMVRVGDMIMTNMENDEIGKPKVAGAIFLVKFSAVGVVGVCCMTSESPEDGSG